MTFVEINANSLQLEIVVTNVTTGGVDAMLSGHDLNGRTYIIFVVLIHRCWIVYSKFKCRERRLTLDEVIS